MFILLISFLFIPPLTAPFPFILLTSKQPMLIPPITASFPFVLYFYATAVNGLFPAHPTYLYATTVDTAVDGAIPVHPTVIVGRMARFYQHALTHGVHIGSWANKRLK